MMQGMIRSLTEYGVIPKASPTQSQSQSVAVDKETPQVIDLSEGELSNSEPEGPDSGTPELDQLMLTAEEQLDYGSFALVSPSVTRAPLWKFSEETPFSSQTRPQAQTITVQAQPVTSTVLRQSLQVVRLRHRLQLKLCHRPQLKLSQRLQLKLSRLSQLKPTYLSHRPLSPWGLDACLQTLFMRIGSLWIFQRPNPL